MVSVLATHAKGLGSNLGTGVDFSLCESCLVILVSDPRHYKRSGEGLARVSCTHALSVVFTHNYQSVYARNSIMHGLKRS